MNKLKCTEFKFPTSRSMCDQDSISSQLEPRIWILITLLYGWVEDAMLLFKIKVMLCQLSVHTKVISTCIYSFPNSFLLDYYITLAVAPCAIQSRSLLLIILLYNSVYMLCWYMTLDKLLKLLESCFAHL